MSQGWAEQELSGIDLTGALTGDRLYNGQGGAQYQNV